MRTIQALLVLLCTSLFAVGSASAGGPFTPGNSPAGAADDAGYTLAKSNGITVTICGPWNNWCSPSKGGNQKCGKWNNWCGQAKKDQKCGKWNNWCGQASTKTKSGCGNWNNWCKDPQTGADTRGKKDDDDHKKAVTESIFGDWKINGPGN
jgi:hypothetical protein